MSDEVQVNESTADIQEPVVKGNGESPLSFDELEALNNQVQNKVEPPKEKEQSDKVNKKDLDTKELDSKEKSLEEKVKDKTKEKDSKSKEKEVENKDSKFKIFKARSEDKELDVPADALFEAKVNGKLEQVNLQELINNYSGRAHLDRLNQQISKERKAFEVERKEMLGTINELYKTGVESGDIRGLIETIAEKSGSDPAKVWGELVTKARQTFEEYAKLSPEEWEKRQLQHERDYALKKLETDKAQRQKSQEEQALQQRTRAVQETHQIDEAQFLKLYEELKSSGHFKPEDISPELVGDYYAEVTLRKQLTDFVTELNPELENKESIIAELRNVMVQNPTLTLEDVKDIASEVYGSKALKKLAQKVRKTQPTNTAKPPLSRQRDPLTFDDLD